MWRPWQVRREKTFPIGKLVDSSDDLARLMIVTSYAGTRTVKVYASDGMTVELRSSTKSNSVVLTADTDANDDMDDTVYARLKSLGTYYLAAGGNEGELEISVTGDTVAAAAKPTHVYSYVTPGQTDDDPDVTSYVVRNGTSTDADGGTTYHYAAADIHEEVDRDGDNTLDNVDVTAKIPEATDYKHIHFGVWARALTTPRMTVRRRSTISALASVQNFSGSGMTGTDMPNNGSAMYTGNWVATVQAADEDGNGDMLLEHGKASIDVDFGDGDIEANAHQSGYADRRHCREPVLGDQGSCNR